jgi:hypothetical protein
MNAINRLRGNAAVFLVMSALAGYLLVAAGVAAYSIDAVFRPVPAVAK